MKNKLISFILTLILVPFGLIFVVGASIFKMIKTMVVICLIPFLTLIGKDKRIDYNDLL